MTSKNKILVGCLALLLALSVGYALFSDTITINGTATAKGSFDITVTCETGISSKLGTVESLGLSAESGYTNDNCTVTNDEVTFKTDFVYPGSRRYFTVKFTNTGTITATTNWDEKIKNGNFCIDVDFNVETDLDVCYPLNKNGYAGATFSGAGSVSGYAREYLYTMSDENDNILSNEELVNYYNMETNVITLPQNYSGYLVLGYGIDSDHISGVLNSKIDSTLEIPFIQLTN